METTSKRAPRFLLLMPDDVRTAIERSAFTHGRTVTKEINLRLEQSLGKPSTPGIAPVHHKVEQAPAPYSNDKSPAHALSDIDRAILAVVRAMPPEKQLALLSLFK